MGGYLKMSVIKVTNLDYAQGINSAVRRSMKSFETSLVPVVRQALKDADLEGAVDMEIAIEGYYHETDELKEVFRGVRTLQENYSDNTTSEAIQKLHAMYTNPVFGLQQARRTAINPDPESVANPLDDPVIISSVMDPVSVASKKIKPCWTIDGIMNTVDMDALGEGFVGFAAYVDSKSAQDGKYNPVATTWACETTVLSREKEMNESFCGEIKTYEWAVDADVMQRGKETLEAYNKMFKVAGSEIKMWVPENAEQFFDMLVDVDQQEKIVNLNIDNDRYDSFYHWAVVREGVNEDGTANLKVKEFWAPEIVTTEMYQQDRESVMKYLK